MGFFKSAWLSGNERKALKSIERVTDENLLIEIAENKDVLISVRKSAALKITNENLLMVLVKSLGEKLKKKASANTAEILMDIYKKWTTTHVGSTIAEYNGTRVIRNKMEHDDYRSYTENHTDVEDCSIVCGNQNHTDSSVHSDYSRTVEYNATFNTNENE